MRLRSAKLVLRHCFWTLRARANAASTSSGVHLGTDPSGPPVNGWSTSSRSRSPVVCTRSARAASWAAVMLLDRISAGAPAGAEPLAESIAAEVVDTESPPLADLCDG